MHKDVAKLFANYNKTANDAMNGIIKTLSKTEWEKSLGGYFPTIRSLCSHIYVSDFNWLKRFRNLRSFKTLQDPFFDQAYSHKDVLFEDMGEYLAKQPDMDNRIIAFADELTEADLGSTLKFTNPRGEAQERNAGISMLQFLNHGTHHRGGISVYLDMLGKDNDFSSLFQALK